MLTVTVWTVVALVVAAVGVLALVAAVRSPDLVPLVDRGVLVAELLLVVGAVVDVVGLVVGQGTDELLVHVGYLVVAVTLLPALVRPVPLDAPEDDVRGRLLVLALVCLALVVVVWRAAITA